MWKAVILILLLINHAHPTRSKTNPCPQFVPPAPWLCTGEVKVFYIGKVKCYGPPKIIPCNGTTP
ncbi:Hypothetical predicted protein [Mytilus galloprovincialis]|uniref:Uncharacterized protein n=1 Tax=Mytilus galloprovincialis TaxID=29158 RepID=A0A8B6EZG5_MYTGA|nr:Hypothetical predicted protein [Mytilus galloprovincialis]